MLLAAFNSFFILHYQGDSEDGMVPHLEWPICMYFEQQSFAIFILDFLWVVALYILSFNKIMHIYIAKSIIKSKLNREKD